MQPHLFHALAKPVRTPARALARLATSVLLRHLILLAAAASFTGCSSIKKTAADAAHGALDAVGLKSVPAVQAPKPPPVIALRLEGGRDMNAGEDGRGLSTVIRIYTLREPNTFLSAPYGSFGATEKERLALGSELIDVREIVLAPGQTLELKEKMPPEAGYLGVVAQFRAPDSRRWRLAFAVADAERSGVAVGVHACALSATRAVPLNTTAQQAALLSSVRCS